MQHEWHKRFDGVEYDWDCDGGTGSDTIPGLPIDGIPGPSRGDDDDDIP